jgi:hypothetical protein
MYTTMPGKKLGIFKPIPSPFVEEETGAGIGLIIGHPYMMKL